MWEVAAFAEFFCGMLRPDVLWEVAAFAEIFCGMLRPDVGGSCICGNFLRNA